MSIARLASVILFAALLFGCDSPSVAFQGQPATRVQVDGFTFSVRQNGERAEAMRINRVWRPGKSAILAAADTAIRRATGCDIAANGLQGDQAIVKARLKCP